MMGADYPGGAVMRAVPTKGAKTMSFIYTTLCRLRQAALRAGPPRRIERQSVEEGTGAVFSVAQLLRNNRLHKPILVAAPGTEKVRERVLHALEENDLAWTEWGPPDRTLNAADADDLRMAWVREACDCFIVLGDGETIDFCKIGAALAAVRGRSFMSLVGTDKVRRRLPPVIAVPVAAGSGAEALSWASLDDGQGSRFVIDDRNLVPPFLVQDPELLADVPRPDLAAAGVDGLCLAVEAYLSGGADAASRAVAADAVRGFLSALEPCWNSGGSTSQRSVLLGASRMAGEAASTAGPGYVRALSRAVCRVTGRSFGEVCAPLLPTVLEKYGRHAADRLAALADACGVAEKGTKAEKAAALIGRIRQLEFRIGLPDALEPIGREAVEEIADIAATEANPRYACPAVWTAADCADALRSAGA